MKRFLVVLLLVLASVVGPVAPAFAEEAQPAPVYSRCSYNEPPAWPSFCFQALENGWPWHIFAPDIPKPPAGVIVLGWLGTTMPDRPIHVFVYTRPDGSVVHSRMLHADALERLYLEVSAWLERHQRDDEKPTPEKR